jgi:uncharacterized protein (DUF983 family)
MFIFYQTKPLNLTKQAQIISPFIHLCPHKKFHGMMESSLACNGCNCYYQFAKSDDKIDFWTKWWMKSVL